MARRRFEAFVKEKATADELSLCEMYAHPRDLKREKVRGPLEECMAKFLNMHAAASSLGFITRAGLRFPLVDVNSLE